MGLGKEASVKDLYVRRVAHMLHACGPRHEYADTLKMPENCLVLCVREPPILELDLHTLKEVPVAIPSHLS